MDRFVKITRRHYPSRVSEDKAPSEFACDPQDGKTVSSAKPTAVTPAPSGLSRAAATKYLLKTLSHESNPITHSDIGLRSDVVVSLTTGHQVAENGGRHRRQYLELRNEKLREQTDQAAQEAPNANSKVLQNVRIYISGYLDNTTDIEMKRIIKSAGGRVMATMSGATHILTSQTLCASKIHRILTSNSRHKVHVVRPQWVMDSIDAGRRRLERQYSVITSANKTLPDMLRKE